MAVAWTVQFLDERARAALEALPDDIQARFLRISRLIESAGPAKVHGPYVKHLEGEFAHEGQRRHCACRLCYGDRPSRDRGACVRQEDREDAAPRNRNCPEKGEGG